VKALDPDAEVVAKIESRSGLDYTRLHGASLGRLMAARGDLFLELRRPHHLIRALDTILRADADAIVASRILGSLAWESEPAAQDITDVAYLVSQGYRTLMLGDEVCLRRDSVIAALNVLQCVARDTLALSAPAVNASAA
jgi:pyruvate kinase